MRTSLLYEKGYASTVSSYGSPSSPTSPWSSSSSSDRRKKRRDSVPVVFPRKGTAIGGQQTLATTTLGIDGYSLHRHQQSHELTPRQTKSMNYPVSPPFAWDPHIDDLDIIYAKMNGISSITPLGSLSASSTIGPADTHCPTRNNSLEDTDMEDGHMDGISPLEDLTTSATRIPTNSTTTHHLPVELLKVTNELMKARLDILSDAISSKHHHNPATIITSNNDHQPLIDLISGCIKHAERLEQLASAHLVSERHLRTVLLQAPHHDHSDTDNGNHDELDRKLTTWYHDQIRQCVHLYEQQVFMTESLQDMLLDIQHYDPPTQPSPTSSSPLPEKIMPPVLTTRWDFTCSVASLLGIDDMQDRIHAIKYQVGMFIGEGIGTGHFIHPPRTSPAVLLPPSPPTRLSSPSPTFCVDQLTSLPKHRWVPDDAMQQCQVSTCSILFSLIHRRHHCRR
ncbi:hypothetical protein BCR42DRAFT_424089 [Absidia repens]|uniref:Uncharacterized protein n=1 Tax=Absidia repens TaxID=90262 RepID=A0A1X2I4Q7_9FUNG|nr:hypothetical protein BCR42DRAFT_424089 [Absidia repens]